jgi:hypothetical protein
MLPVERSQRPALRHKTIGRWPGADDREWRFFDSFFRFFGTSLQSP